MRCHLKRWTCFAAAEVWLWLTRCLALSLPCFTVSGRSEPKIPSHVARELDGVWVGPEMTLEIDPELASKRTNTG